VGADSTAKIVDASSNAESTIIVEGGATLFLENITVSGGKYGVYAASNSNLLMSGEVTIEGFTERGISVSFSSFLGADEAGRITINGTGTGTGVRLAGGASGWVFSSTISNVEIGLSLYGQSMTYLYDFTIEASQRGITLHDGSTVVMYGEGTGVIEGTSDRAINVNKGVFTNWDGTLEIKNLSGGRGINFSGSKGAINNLTMPDFNNTGSGWGPALSMSMGSSVEIRGAEISGSTDDELVDISDGSVMRMEDSTISGSATDNLVEIWDGSSAEIRDSTLTAGSAGSAIQASGSSRLEFRNSSISGSATDNLVRISDGSSAELRDSTISGSTTDGELVDISDGSVMRMEDSTLTAANSAFSAIRAVGSSRLEFRNSSISASFTGVALIEVDEGSSGEIRDATLTLDSGQYAVSVADSSDLSIRSSTISGTATDALVDVRRVSNLIIRNESTLSQTGSETPDVSVSNLSLLSVWSDSSINSVDCYAKGTVSADEGTVTDLATSCTE
jgi:hypothetical protein